MEIDVVAKTKKRERVVFVRVNPDEAIQLIRSLTNQLLAKNPNVGRLEQYAKNDGTYVSIGVHDDV